MHMLLAKEAMVFYEKNMDSKRLDRLHAFVRIP